MDTIKIIIRNKSVNHSIILNGKDVKNGDVVDVNVSEYEYYVNELAVAIPYTEEDYKKVQKLIKSAEVKRVEVADKFIKAQNELKK